MSSSRQTWLVVFAFVLGTIAIPTLHLTFHTLPHEHSGANPGHHHHGGRRHSHHPLPPSDPRHGDGSTAHFSLAIGDGADTTVPCSPVVLSESDIVAPAPETATVAAHFSVQRFRGPPARG